MKITEDKSLMHDGRHSLMRDLVRSFKIWREFYNGCRVLRPVQNCVTIFGSARLREGSPYYEMAFDTAALLGANGFSIMTGGGPGIMEAANKGAKSIGATSIGCNIKLPHEETENPYIDIEVHFDYFFIRKVMLLKYSRAFVLLPGGFGTMDELFETITLMQTRKINDFPVIIMGSAYWKPLEPFIRETMIGHKTISPTDLDYLQITDDPQEVLEIISTHKIKPHIL